MIFISFLRKLGGHGGSLTDTEELGKQYKDYTSKSIKNLFPEFLATESESKDKLKLFVTKINDTLYAKNPEHELLAICDRDL